MARRWRMPNASASPANSTGRWLTPPAIAEQLGVDPEKVLGWIRRGELSAVNVADRVGGRPRFRVSPEAFSQFLQRRQTAPTPKPVRQRKAAFQRKYYT